MNLHRSTGNWGSQFGQRVSGDTLARREYRAALIDFIATRDPSSIITLSFNSEASMLGARHRLKLFSAMVDRLALGPRYAKRRDRRYVYIAVPEHITTNFHFHTLGSLPRELDRYSKKKLTKRLTKLWKKLVPEGSFHFKRITDVSGIANYVTKEIRIGHVIEDYILSEEFWSGPAQNVPPRNANLEL